MDYRQVRPEQVSNQTGARTCQMAQKDRGLRRCPLHRGNGSLKRQHRRPSSCRGKERRKERDKGARQFGYNGDCPQTQVTVETPKATATTPATATVAAAPQTNVQAAQNAYKEVAPDAVPADAIQTGNGKLVIVIGEEPFNMTMMTANAGGSLGKIAGNKPVIFTILSPEQPYAQMEAAQNYTVRFYPNGQTEPSVILECKKVPSQAPIEGMPRTYIGEILKAKIK